MLKYWLFAARSAENNQLGIFSWPPCVGSMEKPEYHISTSKCVPYLTLLKRDGPRAGESAKYYAMELIAWQA